MYSLIVLGLVPGTHIQINFAEWLAAVACVATLITLLVGRRKHVIRYRLAVWRLNAAIRRQQLA